MIIGIKCIIDGVFLLEFLELYLFFEVCELLFLLDWCFFVLLCILEMVGWFNEDMLCWLFCYVFFINVGCGLIVDLVVFVCVFVSGYFGGVVLDVVDMEFELFLVVWYVLWLLFILYIVVYYVECLEDVECFSEE